MPEEVDSVICSGCIGLKAGHWQSSLASMESELKYFEDHRQYGKAKRLKKQIRDLEEREAEKDTNGQKAKT